MKHVKLVLLATLTGAFSASIDADASVACTDNITCTNADAVVINDTASAATAFYAQANSGIAIQAIGNLALNAVGGTEGITASGSTFAIQATSTGANAVVATGGNVGTAGNGVNAFAQGSGTGVIASSASGNGMQAVGGGAGNGLLASATSGNGVYASSQSAQGVWGVASSSSGAGVYGQNTSSGIGVWGRLQTANNTGNAVEGDNGSSSGYAALFNGRVYVNGVPYCNGCTTFTTVSDVRLKTNIQPMAGALDKLLQLRGVTFEWKNPEEHGNMTGPQRGFIAQEVEKVIPEWVGEVDGHKAINTRGLEAMIVESLRTLKGQNDSLRTDNESLRNRVQALENWRSIRAAGLNGNGLLGIGIGILGAAIFVTRRRAAPPPA